MTDSRTTGVTRDIWLYIVSKEINKTDLTSMTFTRYWARQEKYIFLTATHHVGASLPH